MQETKNINKKQSWVKKINSNKIDEEQCCDQLFCIKRKEKIFNYK